MKVKDLFKFNPEAELLFIGGDCDAKPLTIYGWGGFDGSDKEDCTSVALKLKNWTENNEK